MKQQELWGRRGGSREKGEGGVRGGQGGVRGGGR